jgi:RND family efflux transporter MFP subunit
MPVLSLSQKLISLGVIILLLGTGIFISKKYLDTSPRARKHKTGKMKTLVDVMEALPVSERLKIKAHGKVMAAQKINLKSRVNGTVLFLHPDFIPGGIIKKGEVLLKLDDTDLQLNLRVKENNLVKAQADLRIEKANQDIARLEWEQIAGISDDLNDSSKDIALRKPQLLKAEANLNSCILDIEKTRNELLRTILTMPFTGMIDSINIGMGSQVSPQAVLGSLIDINSYWVECSLVQTDLDYLSLPGEDSNQAFVKVFSGKNIYPGRILKLLPGLAKDALMARLLIEINDPLGIGEYKGRKPLLLESFVRVEIFGKQMENIFKFPRIALRSGNKLFLMENEKKLHIQPVSIVWEDRDYVFVDKGVEPGEKVIISRVPAPVEGKSLFLKEKNKTPDHES